MTPSHVRSTEPAKAELYTVTLRKQQTSSHNLVVLEPSKQHAPFAYCNPPTEGRAGWAYHDAPRAVCVQKTPRQVHNHARYTNQPLLPSQKPDQVGGQTNPNDWSTEVENIILPHRGLHYPPHPISQSWLCPPSSSSTAGNCGLRLGSEAPSQWPITPLSPKAVHLMR